MLETIREYVAAPSLDAACCDDALAVHVHDGGRSLCGAARPNHGCDLDGSEATCRSCGRLVCVYCRLLVYADPVK